MTYSITRSGKPLSKDLYTICEKTKTFSSNECDLVLDFGYKNGWTFTTESHCTFKTGSECIFSTGSYCTFTAGWDCTFKTGSGCVFNTYGYDCTFKTGGGCTVLCYVGRIKMILIEEPAEFKCSRTEFLFKVGAEYVTQDKYEMYRELIS